MCISPDIDSLPRYEYDEHDCDEREVLTKAAFLWLGKGTIVRLDCSMQCQVRTLAGPRLFPADIYVKIPLGHSKRRTREKPGCKNHTIGKLRGPSHFLGPIFINPKRPFPANKNGLRSK